MGPLAENIRQLIQLHNLYEPIRREHRIAPQAIKVALRRGQVSDRLIQIVSELAKIDSKTLFLAKSAEAHGKFLSKVSTNVSSLLARQKETGFFSAKAGEVLEAYGRASHFHDEAHALDVLSKSVTDFRISGDYRTASINGVILARWLFGTKLKNLRTSSVFNAVLTELGKVAGQAQDVTTHRFADSLAKAYFENNSGDLLAKKLHLDIRAQLSETEKGANTQAAKAAIPLYNQEIEIGRTLLAQRSTEIIGYNQAGSLVEAHYNKITAMSSAGRHPDLIEQALLEMEALATEIEGAFNIPCTMENRTRAEDRMFRRLLHGQFLLKRRRYDDALRISEALIGDVGNSEVGPAYLIAKANLFAGKAKMETDRALRTSAFSTEIESHRRVAVGAYEKIGNSYGIKLVERELHL